MIYWARATMNSIRWHESGDVSTTMTAVDIGYAREWISDAFDVDASWFQPLDVVRAIRRHYVGGIAQFLRDGARND